VEFSFATVFAFKHHVSAAYVIVLSTIAVSTIIKLYNTLAIPLLLYGSETWTVKTRDARRITAAEMKYMRRTAGYIWTDYKTNAQIAKELKITPISDKLLEYMRN
jgi:ABC-type ATPase involved in cell division